MSDTDVKKRVDTEAEGRKRHERRLRKSREVVVDRTSSMTAGQIERVLVHVLRQYGSGLILAAAPTRGGVVQALNENIPTLVAEALEEVLGK